MGVVTIYHNPSCGTSRNALAMIRRAGIQPDVIEYLKAPPSRDRLLELAFAMRLPLRGIVRERGTPFKELGLDKPSVTEDDLLAAMIEHPILINRPIVVTPKGTMLCRPSDIVLDVLPSWPKQDFDKDDGIPFLEDHVVTHLDEVELALSQAELPTDDLRDAGRTFFRYSLLGGMIVGYGGYELYGQDALFRSVVRTERSIRNVGPSLAHLLMARAFHGGARQGFVLPNSDRAKAFFENLGFVEIDRSKAPAAILATRQASALCPTSTPLLTRRLTL